MSGRRREPRTKRERSRSPMPPTSSDSLSVSPSTIETLHSMLPPPISPTHLSAIGSFTPATFRRPLGPPARRLPPLPPRLVAPPPPPPPPLPPPPPPPPPPQQEAKSSIPSLLSSLVPDIDTTTPEPIIRPFGSVYLRPPVTGMEACDDDEADEADDVEASEYLRMEALKFRRANGRERLDAHSTIGRVYRKVRLRRSREKSKLRQKRQHGDDTMERRYSSSTNSSTRPSTPKGDVGYGMEWKHQTPPARNGTECDRMVWSAGNSPVEAVP